MSAVRQSSVCVVLLLFLLAAAATWRPSEGRYLPTRADNTRYENIREAIRALLDETEGSRMRQSYPYEDVLRSKRSVFKQNFATPLQA